MIIAVAIICAVLGIAIGYLLGHSAKTEVAVLKSQLEMTKAEAARAFEEQKARFDDISQRLVAEAKNATEEMLKQLNELRQKHADVKAYVNANPH